MFGCKEKTLQELRLKAIEDLETYWTIDTSDGKFLLTIKNLSWLRSWYLLVFKRFTLFELYAWVGSKWATSDYMCFRFPITHDNFLMSNEIKKTVPRGYQLQNDWVIPNQDLKYLCNGPLLSQDGKSILVHAHGFFMRLIVKYERPVTFVSKLLGIVVFIKTVGDLILEMI